MANPWLMHPSFCSIPGSRTSEPLSLDPRNLLQGLMPPLGSTLHREASITSADPPTHWKYPTLHLDLRPNKQTFLFRPPLPVAEAFNSPDQPKAGRSSQTHGTKGRFQGMY
jgi:hypothetical protein